MKELNKWQTFKFTDFTSFLPMRMVIKSAYLGFLQQVVAPLKGNFTICFMFKIQNDQGFKSITHLQEFNLNKFPKSENEDKLLFIMKRIQKL